MTMTEMCTCRETSHPHHAGTACDRPAIAAAQEIEPGPDTSLGLLCLDCYRLLAVEKHEEDPDAVVDLNVPPSFPMCETPNLGR